MESQSASGSSQPLVRIGTRASKLAVWQAEFVAARLQNGGLFTQIVFIDTKGDKILDTSIAKIGSKGVFTEELEEQLRNRQIDLAVHSAKDLQSSLPDDLEILAFSEREQVNDVLVSFNKNLPQLADNQPFIIGTSSTRRVALLRHYFPHIQTADMRGNLQTRLQKMQNGACDALLLAYAGVHRMGFDEQIASLLPVEVFTPAVGQGSIAIECSRTLERHRKQHIRALLNHTPTEKCLLAERSFLHALQGGCSIPVFGLAVIQAEELVLTGGIISLDGKQLLRHNLSGPVSTPEILGTQLAESLLAAGGGDILADIRRQA